MHSVYPNLGQLLFRVIFAATVLGGLPVYNLISQELILRNDEAHLNRFRDPDAYASFLIKTQQTDKTTMTFRLEIFFTSKPSLKKRLAKIRKWKADHLLYLPHFNIRDFSCYSPLILRNEMNKVAVGV